MADKRMFSKSITESDAFLEMPLSAQALYFHLSMNADDCGMVGNPKSLMRAVNAANDDMRVLIAKRFIIEFESGVIAIKHWYINNWLRKDRNRTTNYRCELALLEQKDNEAYRLRQQNDCQRLPSDNQVTTDCQSDGNHYEKQCQPRGEEKRREENRRVSTLSGKPDCTEEVISYLNAKSGKSYRASSRKTQSLIAARLNEGFKSEDFHRVIDNKCRDWKSDKKMENYLRPETLFGTKFEGYLNEGSKAVNKYAEYDL